MVVQVTMHAIFQSIVHLVQLEPNLVLGNNGNPLLVLLSDLSELILCLLGSDEFLVQLFNHY